MKKTGAVMLALVLCSFLFGCGESLKNASAYFPYNDTLRIDASKSEIIQAEGLIEKELTGKMEPNRSYYKPEQILFQGLTYDAEYYFNMYPFNDENSYIAVLVSNRNNENFDKEYKALVKYFSKLYGKGEYLEIEPDEMLKTSKETLWRFKIDTGESYQFFIHNDVTRDANNQYRLVLNLQKDRNENE